ncbi:MAG: hypothetical protein FWC62_08345 [Firmicutes bacterium]|nr:hypothetical protein [Bacillota bacterium]
MRKSVKTLARCALLAALGVVLNYLASALPLAGIAIVAVAGFLTAAAVIHAGLLQAFAVFGVTAALSLLLTAQNLNPALLYTAFLGYYPALKSFLERKIRPTPLCWVIKLLLFNAVFALLFLISAQILLSQLGTQLPWAALQALGNIVFVVYDIGLSRLIGFYIRRVAIHVK